MIGAHVRPIQVSCREFNGAGLAWATVAPSGNTELFIAAKLVVRIDDTGNPTLIASEAPGVHQGRAADEEMTPAAGRQLIVRGHRRVPGRVMLRRGERTVAELSCDPGDHPLSTPIEGSLKSTLTTISGEWVVATGIDQPNARRWCKLSKVGVIGMLDGVEPATLFHRASIVCVDTWTISLLYRMNRVQPSASIPKWIELKLNVLPNESLPSQDATSRVADSPPKANMARTQESDRLAPAVHAALPFTQGPASPLPPTPTPTGGSPYAFYEGETQFGDDEPRTSPAPALPFPQPLPFEAEKPAPPAIVEAQTIAKPPPVFTPPVVAPPLVSSMHGPSALEGLSLGRLGGAEEPHSRPSPLVPSPPVHLEPPPASPPPPPLPPEPMPFGPSALGSMLSGAPAGAEPALTPVKVEAAPAPSAPQPKKERTGPRPTLLIELERRVQSGESLAELDLREADLMGAALRGARLVGIDLSHAILTNADLSEADLSRAKLDSALLEGAKLDGATLTRASLGEANLTGASLSKAQARECQAAKANFTNANLEGADFRRANLKGALLQGACATELDAREVDLAGGDLSRAKLERASLRNSTLTGAIVIDAIFADADLRDADLRDVKPEGALQGANLTRARRA